MKTAAKLLLFLFVTFLSMPTIVGVIEKSCDTSVFYTMTEEEETHKDLKVVFSDLHHYELPDISASASSLIISENLSRHGNVAAAIFIPPPELV
jgi:hypothetical protein